MTLWSTLLGTFRKHLIDLQEYLRFLVLLHGPWFLFGKLITTYHLRNQNLVLSLRYQTTRSHRSPFTHLFVSSLPLLLTYVFININPPPPLHDPFKYINVIIYHCKPPVSVQEWTVVYKIFYFFSRWSELDYRCVFPRSRLVLQCTPPNVRTLVTTMGSVPPSIDGWTTHFKRVSRTKHSYHKFFFNHRTFGLPYYMFILRERQEFLGSF